jgi:hypothetical protein
VFQFMRLAVSKVPNNIGISFHLNEDGTRSDFRNVLRSTYLKFRTTYKVHEPRDSEAVSCLTPYVHSYVSTSQLR